jgi:hypothetical protein
LAFGKPLVRTLRTFTCLEFGDTIGCGGIPEENVENGRKWIVSFHYFFSYNSFMKFINFIISLVMELAESG